jgi:hypothetical protein
VSRSEGLSSPESEYAKEGSLAHEIAAGFLENKFFTLGERLTIPQGVSQEMLEAVRVYVDFVAKEASNLCSELDKGHVLIEHKFDLESVHPGLFGTADAVLYGPREKKLVVIDYKHGAGISVEVENNLQLKYYGLGALLSTAFPCETVELIIVQPRCGDTPIKRWAFPSVELLDFAADLAHDAKRTEDKNAPLNPGKHCRFCPAAATNCEALRQEAQAMAKLEFRKEISYDEDQLTRALKFLPAFEAWIKRVREFSYNEAIQGRTPKGWKLVEKRATRKWAASEEEIVKYMRDATKKDINDFYEKSLKSPAQMEKLASKQINAGLRNMMVTVSSGYNLVEESDVRPAVKFDPKNDFAKIEGDTND